MHALDQQLGLDVVAAEPFGLEASAGSTPLRLRASSARRRLRRDALREALCAQPPQIRPLVQAGQDRHLRAAGGREAVFDRAQARRVRGPHASPDAGRGAAHAEAVRIRRDHARARVPHRDGVLRGFSGDRQAKVDDRVIDDALGIVRRMWDAGVAHRDIKPSNVLVRDGRVLLIDVAFATVRPTPWRQAVDLANMMLTLALASTPEHVYERALRVFAAEDVAEAFAASRSITIPSQLRSLVRADQRDLIGQFRRLAPKRRQVPIQLWGIRRVAVTAALVAALVASDGRAGGLREGGGTAMRPSAGDQTACPAPRPSRSYLAAAVAALAAAAGPERLHRAAGHGAQLRRSAAAGDRGAVGTRRVLCSLHPRASAGMERRRVRRRQGRHKLPAQLRPRRRAAGEGRRWWQAAPSRAPRRRRQRGAGVRTYLRSDRYTPRFAGTLYDVFPGGCVTYSFDFELGASIALMEQFESRHWPVLAPAAPARSSQEARRGARSVTPRTGVREPPDAGRGNAVPAYR